MALDAVLRASCTAACNRRIPARRPGLRVGCAAGCVGLAYQYVSDVIQSCNVGGEPIVDGPPPAPPEPPAAE